MTGSEIDFFLTKGDTVILSFLHKSGVWVEIFSEENTRDNLIGVGEIQEMFELALKSDSNKAVLTSDTMVLRVEDFSALRIEIK